MRLRNVRESSMAELNARTGAFIAACGYEHRSPEISRLITAESRRVAICFNEWTAAVARPENERKFRARGFELVQVGGNEPLAVQQLVSDVAPPVFASERAVAFDISSMTRAWHGAIVRQLWTMDVTRTVEAFFAYVPATFRKPSVQSAPNEFVAPVHGFASLATPDLPVAAIMGLGYEKERALGVQQLLDPQQTLLLVPRSSKRDPFYTEVLRSNRDILSRTPQESVFEYSLSYPAATFATLASVVAGLRETYRVVLISLGPKILGLLCFLLATRFPDVSVWRVSSGVHGRPRDAVADLKRVVVLSTTWGGNAL